MRYRAIEDYSGVCCPVTKGVKTFFTTPCTEEPRIALSKGDLILATRGLKLVAPHLYVWLKVWLKYWVEFWHLITCYASFPRHWMYGEKILISAADGMEQLISLFLLKIANQFYSYLEMWPILYVHFSNSRMITLLALTSLHSFYSLHLIDFPVLINIKWLCLTDSTLI